MAGHQRDAGGAENAHRIDAVMLVEAAVFRGDKGFDQLWRHLLQRQRNTALLAVLGDQFAIRAVHLHGRLQAHIFQRVNVGQLRLYIFVQTINRASSQQDATHCKD